MRDVRQLAVSALAVALLMCAAHACADEFWNQFRGPRGDGTSLIEDLPVTFSEGSPGRVAVAAIH